VNPLDPSLLEWLLTADEPWARWAAMAWLQRRPPDDPELLAAHRATLQHPLMQAQLEPVLSWPWPPLTNHKQAKHPLHRMGLLLELGLSAADPEGETLAERLLQHQDEGGAFQTLVSIPRSFGGSGEPAWTWMACDAPLVLAALARLGFAGDARVLAAAEHLAGLPRENGCPCASSVPRFRGPGRKADPCPYANLLLARALCLVPTHRHSAAALTACEMLLRAWEQRGERKFYLFGIGSDYARPRFPLLWYDLLHAVDVLSRFPSVVADPRFQEQLALLRSQALPDGRYKPRSVWMACKGFDFAQKRGPSPTFTAAVLRIEARLAG